MPETDLRSWSDAPAGSPRRSRRRRRWPFVAAALVVLLVAGVVVAGYGYYRWCGGASGPQTDLEFTITEGSTGDAVVTQLRTAGVIRCELAAKIKARSAAPDGFDAGDYVLTTNMTPDAAFDVLAEGPVVKTVDVTIPEGWRLTQITEELSQRLKIPEPELRRVAENATLPPFLPAGSQSAEGFLFPKTYTFARGVGAEEAVQTLLDQFEQEAGKLSWSKAGKLGVTPYEAVVIASLIEREVRVPSERSRVAAVIYNRLDRGEILGIDASNQYIDPDPSDGLTDSDLAIDSPYNSRLAKYAGQLPPTPIASPGLASLRAALAPANTDDWLYVLCGEDGSHAFTDSFAEFSQLKEQCL